MYTYVYLCIAGSLATSCNPSYWEASYCWLLPIRKEKSGVIWHFGVRTMDLDNVKSKSACKSRAYPIANPIHA